MKKSAEVERNWFSYQECCALFGLSRGTLWKLCASGRIDAAKVGKRVLISRRSLEDYLASQAYTEVGSSHSGGVT